MSEPQRVDIQYYPSECTIIRKPVWAVVTRQPDGAWRIVNCLDKDEPCFQCECVFTTDQGEWPYATPPVVPAEQAHAVVSRPAHDAA